MLINNVIEGKESQTLRLISQGFAVVRVRPYCCIDLMQSALATSIIFRMFTDIQ
jgi:hypothetical protein